MSNDCKECLQRVKKTANFRQMTDEQKRLYWENVKELSKIEYENATQDSKFNPG